MSGRFEARVAQRLEGRRAEGRFREMRARPRGLVDLCSNDYLGVVRHGLLQVHEGESGSTGSRLLSGTTDAHEALEQLLAQYYQTPRALVFSSGYQANVGVCSTLPERGDTVLYDELCHASLRDGIRLSFARSHSFRHNDVEDLKKKASRARGQLFVVVESIYSMDGDAPLIPELLQFANEFGAILIIDEAHACAIAGDHGEGLVGYAPHIVKVVTFGKGFGAHGAAVLASPAITDYLVNCCRSFIYSTAISPREANTIYASHELVRTMHREREQLRSNVAEWRAQLKVLGLDDYSVPSSGPIQCVVIPGNECARQVSRALYEHGFDARAVLSPTVPQGKERIRFCVHSFTNIDEIKMALAVMKENYEAP